MRHILAAAFACLACCLLGGFAFAEQIDQNPPPISNIATLPTLFDFSGGPKEALQSYGIRPDFWITDIYQGMPVGQGSHPWVNSTKADLFLTLDTNKLGLWQGFSVNLHQEWTWGTNLNFAGGTLLPVNTPLAWPTAGGDNSQTSIIVTQKLNENVSVTLGKFNMLDQASKTPIRGGGGYDNFMNIAPTAPITGIIPAYILGGNVQIKTDPATFTLFIYDPRNAQQPEVIQHPFDDGVTVNGSVTVPVKIAGLTGYQGIKAVYSDQRVFNFADIPQLFLPPQAFRELHGLQKGWFVDYEFEQYVYQNPANPQQGWGVFGYVSLSQGNPNPLKSTYFFGLAGTSFLPMRGLDRWGVMYFRDNVDPTLIQSLATLGVNLGNEQGFELFYNYAVTGWFHVSSDIQFIMPGLAVGHWATFAGLRSQIKF